MLILTKPYYLSLSDCFIYDHKFASTFRERDREALYFTSRERERDWFSLFRSEQSFGESEFSSVFLLLFYFNSCLVLGEGLDLCFSLILEFCVVILKILIQFLIVHVGFCCCYEFQVDWILL